MKRRMIVPLTTIAATLVVVLLTACEETTPTPPTTKPPPVTGPVTIEDVRDKTGAAIRLIPDLPSGYLQPLRADLVRLQTAIAERNGSVRMLNALEAAEVPVACPAGQQSNTSADLVMGTSGPMLGCYAKPLPGTLIATLNEMRSVLQGAVADGTFPEDLKPLAETALRSLDQAPPMAQVSSGLHDATVRMLEELGRWLQAVVASLPPELAQSAPQLESLISSIQDFVRQLNASTPYVVFLPTDEQLQAIDEGIRTLDGLEAIRPPEAPSMASVISAMRDVRNEWEALRP